MAAIMILMLATLVTGAHHGAPGSHGAHEAPASAAQEQPAERPAARAYAAIGPPDAESARTRADHEQIAAWYGREAGMAADRMAAHRRMLALYVSPYPDYGNPGVTGHCANLAERYRQAAEDNRVLAALHGVYAESVE